MSEVNVISSPDVVNNSNYKRDILALQSALRKRQGTVTYVFTEEKEFPTYDGPNGEYTGEKVFDVETFKISAPLNDHMFELSLSKVYDILKDTAWDLGATEFLIN